MNHTIETRDVTKTFRPSVVAVNGLDLAVPQGAVFGLIGRNGAGKSTCLRLLMGLLRPDRGSARILGHDLLNASHEVRRRVAYVSQEQQLPWRMTPAELAVLYARLYSGWDEAIIRDLLKRFDLPPHRPVTTLSGGDQRRVAVALALASRPEVLILDEPAAGLDPVSRRQLIEAMVEFLGDGGERTILFSTHILADLERVADHVGFMDRGRMLFSGALDNLLTGRRRIQLIFSGDRVPEGFSVPGLAHPRVEGPVLTGILQIQDPAALDRLRALEGVRLRDEPVGLEDLFIELLDQPDAESARSVA